MGLQATPIPDLWGFQAPQVSGIRTLVDHLTAGLGSSVAVLQDVTYDSQARLATFKADGVSYMFSYPDMFTVNLAIIRNSEVTVKQLSLNGAGQLVSVVTL